MEPKPLNEQHLLMANGDLADRIEFAKNIGNHLVDGFLLKQAIIRTARAYYEAKGLPQAEMDQFAPLLAPPPGWVGMPTTGNVRVFALLIDFADYPHTNTAAAINAALFGTPATGFPYESLAAFYKRASYDLLDLGSGATLGWYRASMNRSQVAKTMAGREALIKEAIQHFNNQGHDFSQYDNNHNGVIDYFLVFWTGPDTGWATFWWGYQTSFSDPTFTVDGVRLGKYSWQWEANPVGGAFNPRVAIHETGHALGVPDYYDYDDSVGPDGGLGGADMMDANRYDHNCFTKWMLDWLTPAVIAGGSQTVMLNPTGSAKDCVAVWPGIDSGDLFSEYFMVQNRQKVQNDTGLPGQGLLVWHVDATLDAAGVGFASNNSFSDHKLLRLMEADGEEDIEALRGFDAGDFYNVGESFGPASTPSSKAYSGGDTNIVVTDIVEPGSQVSALIRIGGAARYQSIFGRYAPDVFQNYAPGNYNYEVVIRESTYLRHYWFNYRDGKWYKGASFGANVIGRPAMFQNSAPGNDNYEVIVREGNHLQHYWYKFGEWVWHKGSQFGANIQSDPVVFQNQAPGNYNYEVVVREGSHLQHYWYAYGDWVWHKGRSFGSNVSGQPMVFQNRAPGNYNYEVVVRESGRLRHYWFNYADGKWYKGSLFGANIKSDPAVFQNHAPGNYNYEVVVRENNNLQHYWFTYGEWVWHKGNPFGANVLSTPAAFQNYAPGNNNYEVVVREGTHLQHYWYTFGEWVWHKGEQFGVNVQLDPAIFQNHAPGNNNYEVLTREGTRHRHYWFTYGDWIWHKGNQFG